MPVLLVLLLCFGPFRCFADGSNTYNPSGVWDYQKVGAQARVGTFSWGENPTSVYSTIIDLGASPPIVSEEGTTFIVMRVSAHGSRVQFTGKWVEGGPGMIAMVLVDQDTMWFESTVPPGQLLCGPEHYYKRVPVDAKVVPIDPEKGP